MSIELHMSGAPRVLVVDDESINVMVLNGMLQAAGFATLTATDGPSGREQARQNNPDIILLDIMMPGENGFETCKKLKSDAATTDIPIIFISALSDVDNKVKGLEMGAVDYITKPFEKAEVMARIRLHLKLKFATRAIIEEQAARLQQIADAQQSMLVTPEDEPAAQFSIAYQPILEAGGDFYDVFAAGGASHCYFLADICGHDLGASFVTSSLKALVRQNSGPLYTPLETMKNINSVLHTLLKEGKYLTAQALYVHRGQMTATVLNAGHLPVVHVDNEGAAHVLEAEGDILGAFETICVEPLQKKVKKGERLYMFTDGLVERFRGERRSVSAGIAMLAPLLEEGHSQPLHEAVESVVAKMFPAAESQEDDVVLLGVEV